MPYVLEGRQVIVARTFSKIAALAPMRLGYAVAPADMIARMRPYSMGSINALVKHGGVASIKDTQAQADIKARVIALRNNTTRELEVWGYSVIPSQANFLMVSRRRSSASSVDSESQSVAARSRPVRIAEKALR